MLGKLKSKFVNWLLKGVHLQELHIGEHSVVISGTGINMGATKVENVAAPDSDDDVPRRDTIDSKITTHKGDASAHHAKTTTAAGITSGRFPVNRLPAMTDEKIWKGTGNNVEEIDVPIGIPMVYLGDTLQGSADAERGHYSQTYIKVKEITLGVRGPLRIKFDHKMSGTATPSGTAYARIYRNGVAVGTEQDTRSGTYATVSEDIAGWGIGDKCQIYVKHSNSNRSSVVKNFRIYYLIHEPTID